MTTDKKIWGLPKNVFLAGITSFFNDFSSEMILSIFPAFFKAVLKTGASSLGLTEGIADAASNFIKILSGRISDKTNKRKIFVVLGYALSTIIRPFYIGATAVPHVIGLRLTDRVGKGLRDSPRDALISLSTPPAELGRAFGYHRAMDTAGAIAGPMMAYILLRIYPNSFNTIFVTAFIIGILGVISISFVSEVAVLLTDHKKVISRFYSFPKEFKLFLVSNIILATGTLPVAILLLRTQDIGLVIADIPLFYMFYNIIYAVGSWFAGKAADKIGDRSVFIAGYFCLIASYILFLYSEAFIILLIGFFALGLFSALTDSVARSYAGRLTTPGTRGTAFGYLNGATGLGALVAGICGGYVWQNIGPSTALISGAGIIFLGIVVFTLTQPKNVAINA